MSEHCSDLRLMRFAKEISAQSKDPSTKVGALLVKRYTNYVDVVSYGFNKFPYGVKEDDRLNNKEQKYPRIVHAEMVALANARRDVYGCTLYTWPFMPCSICTGVLIEAGVKEFVSLYTRPERWENNFRIAEELLIEAKIPFWWYPASMLEE